MKKNGYLIWFVSSLFFISTPLLATTHSKLYPGERIEHFSGYPSLIKTIKGDRNKPVVVFIPGNAHLARIAYGYPGGNKKDFLSYWLQKRGYSFLAVSYPLGHSVFTKNYPAYTVKNWSQAVIHYAKQTIAKDHLSNRVIIVAWSMGGELAQVIYDVAKKNHIDITLFVGLSAAMPIYGMLPKGPFYARLQPSKSGLANMRPFYGFFIKLLDYQNEINHHIIIPKKIYLSQFVGNTPINIMGTALRYENGKFAYNLMAALKDNGALNVNEYPPIAAIHGTPSEDITLTLFTRADWGSIIMRNYYNIYEHCKYKTKNKFSHIVNIVKKSPSIFVKQIKGSHFFFVGKFGAEKTVNQIIKLIEDRKKIAAEVNQICACTSRMCATNSVDGTVGLC